MFGIRTDHNKVSGPHPIPLLHSDSTNTVLLKGGYEAVARLFASFFPVKSGTKWNKK